MNSLSFSWVSDARCQWHPKIGMQSMCWLGLALATVFLLPEMSKACSMVSIRTPDELVRDAESIVRARAMRYDKQPERTPEGYWAHGVVEFDVIEVLKGRADKRLLVPGLIGMRDDPNDRSVPYDFVRPMGRSGSCFAYEYRLGGEFLLFLRQGPDGITPYWSGLAPTNEQLMTEAPDPWVEWVSKRLIAMSEQGDGARPK